MYKNLSKTPYSIKKTRQDNDYKENNMNKTKSPKLNIEN